MSLKERSHIVNICKYFLISSDLGEHLREQLKSTLRATNKTIQSDDILNKQFAALERISNNIYATKYQRVHSATATGLSGEQCNQVLSSEFLEYLNEDKSTLFSTRK